MKSFTEILDDILEQFGECDCGKCKKDFRKQLKSEIIKRLPKEKIVLLDKRKLEYQYGFCDGRLQAIAEVKKALGVE